MITSAQAQPFGGPSGCCSGPREDDWSVSYFIILAVVLVCAVIFARDLWSGHARRRSR